MDDTNFHDVFKKAFQNFFDIFVTPEVVRRQEIGDLPKPLDLRAAQIIFYPDGRKPDIRINSEVNVIAKAKLKPNVSKTVNDDVFVNEIDGIEGILLTENDDPNSGHVTMLKINDEWIFAFDFTYNKALSLEYISKAEQFIAVADFACANKHWSAFVDNLFSASELLAKAVLLASWFDQRFINNTNHKAIHSRFNKYTKLGNADPKFTNTLNKLSGLRYPARYVNQELKLDEMEAKEYLDVVKKMFEDTKQFYIKYSLPDK